MKNDTKQDKRKSIRISEDCHNTLKSYCKENGLKIEWYISKLIKENCKKEE